MYYVMMYCYWDMGWLILGYDFGHNTQPYIQYGINPFSSTYPVQGHSESYREQIASLSQGSQSDRQTFTLYSHLRPV